MYASDEIRSANGQGKLDDISLPFVFSCGLGTCMWEWEDHLFYLVIVKSEDSFILNIRTNVSAGYL